MANTILTPTAVTREALRVLHQKLNFIGTINRAYDSSFAKDGAKIGSDLKIRLPNQYTVTTGATLAVQDTTETSITLSVTSQKHVAVNFTSVDLTLNLDDFSSRILDPAMAVLAANIESDAMSMYKDVYNQSNQSTITAALSLATLLGGRKKLNDFLAPMSRRIANLTTQNNVDLVQDLKGLFQDSKELSAQYKEGAMGRAAGFDFYENSLWARHTSGTDANAYRVNGASQSGSSITVGTGTGTFKKGDIITFVGCNAVHHESKADLGYLKQFAITADIGANATTLTITPAIVLTGAKQNVSAAPTTGGSGIVTKVGGASGQMDVSMLYHPDAFTFATADLIMPKGVDFAAREVQDGISLRIVRQYDINNDQLPCRIDVLYGYKTIRGELACRMASNSTA
jgi:hypothetical protein